MRAKDGRAGRRYGARGAGSALLRIPNHGGNRTVPGTLPGLRAEDRKGGAVAQQGVIQQALRTGCGIGLRECFGAERGQAVRVRDHSDLADRLHEPLLI